jgi:hypothetical protein
VRAAHDTKCGGESDGHDCELRKSLVHKIRSPSAAGPMA